MCPYFIEDLAFPYENLDDADLLYCQPDGDWDPNCSHPPKNKGIHDDSPHYRDRPTDRAYLVDKPPTESQTAQSISGGLLCHRLPEKGSLGHMGLDLSTRKH